MKIDIITLFPKMFEGVFSESIIKRAQEKNLAEIKVHYLRDWANDKHRTVDSKPYGGGAGMVIMVEPVFKAISDLKTYDTKVILTSAKGVQYTQQKAKEFSEEKHLIIIAGHYEGYDERIREHLVNEEISIGDYVLTGGELPAMVIADSVVRLIPKVLGNKESLEGETHSKKGHVSHPQYTRPVEFNGWRVPEVLLSGHHSEIKKYRQSSSKKK